MRRVENKVALVTGGGLGLGRACAVLLAREGAKVMITDVKEREGRVVAEEIVEAGGEAMFMRQDVSSETDWDAVSAATLRRFGRLNILVNNAGVALGGSVETTTLEQWRALMAVNLDGVFMGTRSAVAAMKDTGGGSIINLSSIEGLIGDADLAAYNASKGGVRIFTKSAALHCAKAGYKIRVNSVHPGYIWTPMVENYLAAQPDPEAAKAFVTGLHPVGHLGEADDIAYGVLYLASDESKFVTGAELVIDGGYTAQ
ncbi:MAG: glucose 1-dehydrogenase [Caulobacteraceae bacterium]|nr:glucose 1-dehydrogenase [Caulobacteraceae bacterium]MBK8544903.1 glucose 1-dehydrogenase [Caulobacteraceae bacterium]MBP6688685.1 glucose 1-dehydrogenase [Hyphomonadaceae bacterium]